MRAILLLIVVLTACMHRVIENKEEQISSKPPIITRNDFSVYWDGFGQALRDNDTIALDKFLDTIVIFYGREDQDPKFELKNRERIIKVREIYLTGGFYDFQNDTNISYVDFFLNKNALKSDYVEGQDNQNIKDFVFTRNKRNEWKLTAVYNNTKNVNSAGAEIPSVPRK
jgi:hypothetical protein